MDWKIFLGPTGFKLALAALLFLALMPIIDYDTGIRCIHAPCPSTATGSVLVYAYYAFVVFPHTSIYLLNFQMLAIGLVLSYLASCLLVFLLQKYHKQK